MTTTAVLAAPPAAAIQDPLGLVTAGPFAVRILAGGVDVTDRSPVVRVRYLPDGTGWRRLRDGRTVSGRWRFLDEASTRIEVVGPEGLSRWAILELNERIYRKVDLDTGIEFVHTPVED